MSWQQHLENEARTNEENAVRDERDAKIVAAAAARRDSITATIRAARHSNAHSGPADDTLIDWSRIPDAA